MGLIVMVVVDASGTGAATGSVVGWRSVKILLDVIALVGLLFLLEEEVAVVVVVAEVVLLVAA